MVSPELRFRITNIVVHLLAGIMTAAGLGLLFAVVSWVWWRKSFHPEDCPTIVILTTSTGGPVLAIAFALIGEIFQVRLPIAALTGITAVMAVATFVVIQCFPSYGIGLWFSLLGCVIAAGSWLSWRKAAHER